MQCLCKQLQNKELYILQIKKFQNRNNREQKKKKMKWNAIIYLIEITTKQVLIL